MYMLNEREEEEFSFDLIVPEDELIEWNEGKPAYRPDRMEGLRRLAERIWQQPYIYMVQTELELSDPAPTGAEILAGAMPGVEPFAILPKHMWQTYCQSQKGTAVEGDISERFVERTTDRGGVLLRLKGVGTNMSDEKNQEKQDLQERIIALIEDILGVPVGTITLDTLIEDVEEWDSLMHVTIIGELEEQLGISIPLDDAIALQSMQELLEKAGCV